LQIKSGDEAYLLGESAAIMNYICREHGAGTGLQQSSSLDAAKVDEARSVIEDLTGKLAATVRENDPAIKKASREHIATTVIPKYFTTLSARMQPNGHVVGDSISAADLLIGAIYNWISTGVLDGIAADILEPYAPIKKCWENIKADPKLAEFYQTKA
jgi:glutathione S-transferase